MGIFDSIKNFGSSVLSGIGSVISAPFVPTRSQQPTTVTSTLGSSINALYNSAFSRIADWINPPPQSTPAPSAPKTIFTFGGSDPIAPTGSTATTGNTSGGLPQGMGLILVAIGIGYLLFNRIK